MSFTAQVKDELSRVAGESDECALAELSAIVRVCGTLSFHGSGSWSLRVTTETGAVARTMIKLTHDLFQIDTPLTMRRSNLHRAHNFLIEIRDQDALGPALGRAWALPRARLRACCRARAAASPICAAPSWRAASSRTRAATSTSRSP